MRGSSLFYLLAIFLSLTLAESSLRAQGSQTHGLAKAKTEIKVRLPGDTDKPVLVLDNVGGFRIKDPAGFEPTPTLQIFSDGRVLTGRKSNLVKEVEGEIDLVDLQKLLVFISNDCRFFDLTSEMLKSDIEANRIGRIMDAPTTQLEINLKEHTNSISVYGLPFSAGRLADVPSVASMLAILSRCKRLIAMTRLGSEQDAEAAIKAVNKALKEKSPTAPEFTFDNLQSAEQFADGRRSANFVLNFDADGKPMLAYATRELDSGGNESINLDVVEKKPKRGR